MKKQFSLEMIPNQLNVNELMEVKGGISTAGINICIPSGAKVVCDSNTPAKVICKGGGGIVVCQEGVSAVTVNPTPSDSEIGNDDGGKIEPLP